MEAERVGDLVGLTCMGNEGAQWIGMAPFLERKHLVQNLGDGTFFHSGSLAIRAAVAAGVDITYKLLHNGTVAMTGGQDAVGAVGVPDIAKMVLLEGVSKVIVTTDDLDRYDDDAVPRGRRGVAPHPSRRGAEGARRDPGHDGADPRPGVRRREPAGAQPRQARHPRLPGRHQRTGLRGLWRLRRQEQLPVGAAGRHAVRSQDPHRPDELQLRLLVHARATARRSPRCRPTHGEPEAAPARRRARSTSATSRSRRRSSTRDRFTVRLSGIGGTGVVTVSQILGTAAMLDGHTVRGLDQTGLSQKAGPVTSDIRITDEHGGGVEPRQRVGRRRAARRSTCWPPPATRTAAGATPDRTVVIANTHAVPTGEMVAHPDHRLPGLRLPARSVSTRCRGASSTASSTPPRSRPGCSAARRRSTSSCSASPPRSAPCRSATKFLERAIELNGVAVERNIAAFRWGRRLAVDPTAVEDGRRARRSATRDARRDDRTVRRRPRRLPVDVATPTATAPRSIAVRAAEQAVDPDSTALTDAVARNLYKLMAYKDEYEVARLLLLDESQRALRGDRRASARRSPIACTRRCCGRWG